MTTGVILAAGRGSRLQELTDERPKCMVELAGRPLLAWQLDALERAGLDRIVVVTGYQCRVIERLGVVTINHAGWDRTNMVGTLLRAADVLDDDLIVSYSDIVYGAEHVAALRDRAADLALTYDVDWLDLWIRRFEDPLSDAESFAVDGAGRVTDIGRRVTNLCEIEGQFMGLLALSRTACDWIRTLADTTPDGRQRLDTTSLLQGLIRAGLPVHGVPVRGGWCEVDDQDDLAVAEQLLAEGRLPLLAPAVLSK